VSEPLPREQQILLQEIYEVFRHDGSWPVYQYLDKRLDQKHGLAIDEVLAAMPEGLLGVSQPYRPDTPIALRIGGLVHCEGCEEDLVLFARVVQWLVAKESAFEPRSPTASENLELTSTDLRGDWEKNGVAVDDTMLAKVYAFLALEGMHASMGGSATGWTMTVPRDIRRFRRVRNVYDYIELAAQEERARASAVNPLVEPTAVVQPQQRVRAVGGQADPEDVPALTLELLHPLVRDACATPFANKHYRHGVLDAAMALRDLVRETSGLADADDSTLMGKAFSQPDPRIVVADLKTETGKNIQRGTMLLAQGIVARLRNPLVHEKVEPDPAEAMEMVALISRVVRDVEAAKRPDEES
jgi:uncharacterized protein (TIGR02391 family)